MVQPWRGTAVRPVVIALMTGDERAPGIPGLPGLPSPSPSSLRPGIVLLEVRAAWIDFYDAHYQRVVRFVMHNGACFEEAQDAAQEAFTESWAMVESHPGQWQAISSKGSWIRTVALRRYRRPPGPRVRPRLAEGACLPDRPSLAPGPDELAAQTETVLRALHALDAQARVVMAFYLDDFPTAVIADALGLSEQKVRDVKKKARAALKSVLAGKASAGGRQPR
jgi:RNA polymerase sigma factor (sigma-70 family)